MDRMDERLRALNRFGLGARIAERLRPSDPREWSQVLADWPGLAERNLYEGRDLRPTLDTRAVLKGVTAGVFDLTAAQADRIFPGSAGVPGIYDLMR